MFLRKMGFGLSVAATIFFSFMTYVSIKAWVIEGTLWSLVFALLYFYVAASSVHNVRRMLKEA